MKKDGVIIFYISGATLPSTFANSYQMLKTCEALKRQGVGIEFFAFKKRGVLPSDILRFYGINNDFVLNLFSPILKNHFCYNARLVFAILKRKKGRKIILYARETPLIYALMFMKIFFNTPFIYEAHRYTSRSFYDAWRRRLTIKYASGIVAITKGLRELYGGGGKPMAVAFCGTDKKRFENMLTLKEAREKLDIGADKKIIGYVGSLQKYEGVEFLIDAFEDFKNENSEYSNLELWVVGGKLEEIKALQKSQNPDIYFVGYVSFNKVPLYMAAFDILAIPLLKDESGASPVKMFEYLYAEKPIIASDIPAILEVLHDKNNAIIFKSEDKESFNKSLLRVLKDKDFSEKIARNARQDAEKYNFDNRAEIIKNLIQKLYVG